MTLYYQENGPKDAPTIVFLHGMGVSSWMWTEQVEALKGDYHCLTVDLPGNGKSHTTAWKSVADSADQVAEVIRAHATNGKAHLVALSLGGYVALQLVVRHPDMVERVIVSGLSTTPLKHGWFFMRVATLLYPLMAWGPFAKWQAQLLQLPPEAIPLFVTDANLLSVQTVRRVYEEVLYFELPSELAHRPHALLAVAGSREVAAVTQGLAKFQRLLPNAVTRIAPNVHHGWNGENPVLFNAMIQAWIAGLSLPTELVEVKSSPASKTPIPQVEH